jgi:hypothetical protein
MHEYDKSSKWLIQHHGDSIFGWAVCAILSRGGRFRPNLSSREDFPTD